MRTDVIMTALSVWFVLGLFLDAYYHANFTDQETFFTPWHAVFYSGFAATGGWVLWTVWGHVRLGRRGLAAVPVGYGMTMIALPVFAVSGAADLAWHELLGIETTTDIFFSPSHLGLITAMIVILTSPLRSAWGDPELPAQPPLRQLLPAVVTLAFAASLVMLFLTYGNSLVYDAYDVVGSFSAPFVTSVLYIGAASYAAGLPAVTEIWTGAPIVMALVGWALAALMLPNSITSGPIRGGPMSSKPIAERADVHS